ncbi:PHA/PHB synthase family protein [Streptomyces alfalfae]|nr:alpha/beta fold hydrolase [Streptomyces alfalfae]
MAKCALRTALRGASGEYVPTGVTEPGDWRFSDPAWRTSRGFHLMEHSYRLADNMVQELVEAIPVHPNDRQILRFLLGEMVDAAAPPNFFLGNPAALRRAWSTRGRSLLRGAVQLAEDLTGNLGMPQMVDGDRFVKGRDLATSAGSVVFRNDLMELIQYRPRTETVHSIPLLFSPPWVNKYYVADLAPGRSIVESVLDRGHTVFVISYRNPGQAMRETGADDYLLSGLLPALEVIAEITGAEEVNIAGACLGGLLALMLAAWLPPRHVPGLASVTAFNTIADFTDFTQLTQGGLLGPLLSKYGVAALEAVTAQSGYLSGRALDAALRFLRANEFVWQPAASRWLEGRSPFAMDVLAWNADAINVTHRTQQYVMHELWMKNAFARGTAILAGRPVRPDRIRQDVFLSAAADDHIVPWPAAYRTTALLPGDVRFVLVSGGHVAGLLEPSHAKARYWTTDKPLPADSRAWLGAATEHLDSWRNSWTDWLAERSGPRRRPPPTGSARHPVLQAAPGSYIHT